MLRDIINTNGDLLGVPLFILLIIYFACIDQKKWYEWILLVSSMAALIVDGMIVIRYYRR